MKSRDKSVLIAVSFLLLFAVFIYAYLSSNLWDYDFWWHIATGRYIVQNHSLPQHDPFCFTSSLPENKSLFPVRETFILKQYWLAQVLFYLIFAKMGNMGIILLKGAIILAAIFLVSYGLFRKNVKFYVTFVFTFAAFRGLGGFSGERPVLFTILFSVITFLLLEDYKVNKGWKLLFLIPLMMLWANLHGGFILGDVLIAAFMAGESINMVRNKAYTGAELKRFLLISCAAVAASFVNPEGIAAFSIAFSPKYGYFTRAVQEYQPPFLQYISKLAPVEYSYVALVFLFPLIVAFRRKKLDITHLIILGGLWYESLSSMRFTIYYVLIGGIILGEELNNILNELFARRLTTKAVEKIENVFAVVLLLSSVFYAAAFVKAEKPLFREATLFSVPAGGADFIAENHIGGRVFNSFGAGGYLEWRRYPENKTFIDSRAINGIALQEYGFIANAYYSLKMPQGPKNDAGKKKKDKTELWERLLDHYDVNILFLTPVDVYGLVPKLLFKLEKSHKWVLVYNDLLSIVYVKNSEENKKIIRKFRRPNADALNTVIVQASYRGRASANPTYMASLGETFYKMGRLKDALKAYQYSYEKKADPAVLQIMKKIEGEMRQKEKNGRKVPVVTSRGFGNQHHPAYG